MRAFLMLIFGLLYKDDRCAILLFKSLGYIAKKSNTFDHCSLCNYAIKKGFLERGKEDDTNDRYKSHQSI